MLSYIFYKEIGHKLYMKLFTYYLVVCILLFDGQIVIDITMISRSTTAWPSSWNTTPGQHCGRGGRQPQPHPLPSGPQPGRHPRPALHGLRPQRQQHISTFSSGYQLILPKSSISYLKFLILVSVLVGTCKTDIRRLV